MGASTSGELHRCRAGSAGGAGDEHTVAGPDACSLDHVLGGGVGARDRTELGVGPVTLDGKDLARRNLHILGERAVEVRRHPDVVHGVVTLRAHARSDDHALSQKSGVDTLTQFVDDAATVGALDQWPRGRLVPAAVFTVNRAVGSAGDGIGGGLDVGAVPTEAGVDLGVVHARR